MAPKPHIAIAGAGALGCFLGGLLAAAGHRVTLLLRGHTLAELRAHGLTLTDYTGLALRVTAEELTLSDDAACLKDADIVIVTARPTDNPALADQIADKAGADATVISVQDGPSALADLEPLLPQRDVRAGIVAFHVVRKGQGCFHRETNGEMFLAQGPTPLAPALTAAHLTVTDVPNITALQWGRLLINLNDALNALSGLRLQHHLQDSRWRRVMASQWAEGLRVLKANGIKPALGTTTPPGLVPTALRLPRKAFLRVSGAMLDMDPQARTPMSHDLSEGKPTQITDLQGEILRLAHAANMRAPLSARVVDLIELAELAGEGPPHLPPSALRSTL